MLRCRYVDVVFQEVPDELSLLVAFAGCPLQCPGCHSPELWHASSAAPFDRTALRSLIERYRSLISCVCFFGGEWQMEALLDLLLEARAHALKTCLYTGLEDVDLRLKGQLDFLKTGPWRPECGGLDSPSTNQRFVCLTTHQCLNNRFLATS